MSGSSLCLIFSFAHAYIIVSTEAAPDASNPPRKLYVFLHEGNPLGVHSAQLRILKQMYHEGLCRFLQRLDGLALPPELFPPWTAIQSNLPNLSIILRNTSQKSTGGSI